MELCAWHVSKSLRCTKSAFLMNTNNARRDKNCVSLTSASLIMFVLIIGFSSNVLVLNPSWWKFYWEKVFGKCLSITLTNHSDLLSTTSALWQHSKLSYSLFGNLSLLKNGLKILRQEMLEMRKRRKMRKRDSLRFDSRALEFKCEQAQVKSSSGLTRINQDSSKPVQ